MIKIITSYWKVLKTPSRVEVYQKPLSLIFILKLMESIGLNLIPSFCFTSGRLLSFLSVVRPLLFLSLARPIQALIGLASVQ